MSKNHLTLLTQQLSTLQDLVRSSFMPHCDECQRPMEDEGWLIKGDKKYCGACMDHK